MMIVDFHAHLDEPGTSNWAALQGFERTVLLADPDTNAQVLEFCNARKGRFIPFAFLDLRDIGRAAEQARAFVEQGFRGFKFHPLRQRFWPHEARLRPLWETLQRLGVPILTHAGTVAFPNHVVCYADPSGWGQVATDFPELKIVIAHLGGDYSFQALVLAENHSHIYLDTAYLDFFAARSLPRVEPVDLIERAVRFAGAEKVLFASEGMTPEVICRCSAIGLPERQLIFWKNALRVLAEPGG